MPFKYAVADDSRSEGERQMGVATPTKPAAKKCITAWLVIFGAMIAFCLAILFGMFACGLAIVSHAVHH